MTEHNEQGTGADNVDPAPGEPIRATAGDVAVQADDSLLATIEAMGVDLDIDPGDMAEQITKRLLTAESLDDLLSPQEAEKADDWIGKAIEVHGGRWMRSDYDEGAPVYLLIDAVDVESGERVLITCGARNVMAQVMRMHQQGWLPAKVKITRARRASKAGFFPLWLEPA